MSITLEDMVGRDPELVNRFLDWWVLNFPDYRDAAGELDAKRLADDLVEEFGRRDEVIALVKIVVDKKDH
jgi:hypothetical protein